MTWERVGFFVIKFGASLNHGAEAVVWTEIFANIVFFVSVIAYELATYTAKAVAIDGMLSA